jgi:hypothetical protein
MADLENQIMGLSTVFDWQNSRQNPVFYWDPGDISLVVLCVWLTKAKGELREKPEFSLTVGNS